MFRPYRKFIAVLMLLWLPLFSGSALAATVSIQMQQGKCHEAAMSHENMGTHHHHHGETHTKTTEHGPSCSSCGVCHLACTGYLAALSNEMVTVQAAASEITPYLVTFSSFTSAPLVPPPLARA